MLHAQNKERRHTPPPLPHFSQCIFCVFMMVMCCNKSLSSGFHTDHSLDWACFSLFPFSKVLYASVSLIHLFFQSNSVLLLQGLPNSHQRSFAPTRYTRSFAPVSDRRLTAACPGLDSWHGRRTPVPVQASVCRLLLCLYTKKGTQMFFISNNAGLSLGRHAYTSYHAIYLLLLQGTKLEQFM